MQIGIELPAVKLGVLEADEVSVRLMDERLAVDMDAICARVRDGFSVESLAEHAPVRAVREMFRRWGLDPSKYRPSSEALMRRVVQGKGLYRVSNIVDIGNVGSIETGWPFGCYDRGKLTPPIVFRHGASGEKYEGIGKRVWHLEGRPVLADANGPFGSPISDSTRSMITEEANKVLVVIYAPSSAADSSLGNALDRLGERLGRFGGAKITDSVICE
jgi:DNA/RNA-binding domain of Phe-tRNA-synthetase-like protein